MKDNNNISMWFAFVKHFIAFSMHWYSIAQIGIKGNESKSVDFAIAFLLERGILKNERTGSPWERILFFLERGLLKKERVCSPLEQIVSF